MIKGNQIPYDYKVEVRNRFKGLDLIDRLHDELWTEVHDIVQETGIKTNLDSVLKSKDITLSTMVCLVKDRLFQWSCMDVIVEL